MYNPYATTMARTHQGAEPAGSVKSEAGETEERSKLFCCPLCKKWRNMNRVRQVIGFHTWKKVDVCEWCFEESGLKA